MKLNYRMFFAVFLCCNLICASAFACTGIVLRANDHGVIAARTMEFSFDMHSDILVVPSGTKITKLGMDADHTGGQYTAKYGFVGADAIGHPVIVDGMNEKGLYFGAFYFNHLAKYRKLTPENQKQAISSEELGNYILSQFATVAQVRNALPGLVIVGTYIKEIGTFAPFHYAVTDQSGDSIVIEITEKGIKIYDNTVNVVANNPTYDWHLTNLSNYVGLTPMNRASQVVGREKLSSFGLGTGLFGLPGDTSSPSRFVRATAFVNSALACKTAEDAVFSAFHILNNFDIAKGSVRDKINNDVYTDYTVWTAASDTKNLVYYFKTYLAQQVEKVDLKEALKNANAPKNIKMETGFQVMDRTGDLQR